MVRADGTNQAHECEIDFGYHILASNISLVQDPDQCNRCGPPVTGLDSRKWSQRYGGVKEEGGFPAGWVVKPSGHEYGVRNVREQRYRVDDSMWQRESVHNDAVGSAEPQQRIGEITLDMKKDARSVRGEGELCYVFGRLFGRKVKRVSRSEIAGEDDNVGTVSPAGNRYPPRLGRAGSEQE